MKLRQKYFGFCWLLFAILKSNESEIDLMKCRFMEQKQSATLPHPSDFKLPCLVLTLSLISLQPSQAPVKTKQEIYENSMLEDDPNANTQLKAASVDPRWGPKHKGAQTLANFYSSGESSSSIVM